MDINSLIYPWSTYLSPEITSQWRSLTRQNWSFLSLSARSQTGCGGPGCGGAAVVLRLGVIAAGWGWREIMKLMHCLSLSLSPSRFTFSDRTEKLQLATRTASFHFSPLGLQNAALSLGQWSRGKGEWCGIVVVVVEAEVVERKWFAVEGVIECLRGERFAFGWMEMLVLLWLAEGVLMVAW